MLLKVNLILSVKKSLTTFLTDNIKFTLIYYFMTCTLTYDISIIWKKIT